MTALLALAACGSGVQQPAAKASNAPSSAGSSASAGAPPCVADVPRVIAGVSTPSTSALPASTVATLDRAARSSFKNAAAPGAIVGVQTPKGTWTAAYGYADPTTKAPMTVDMHLRIGSVTKTFTGTLILQLAAQGKLSLDDPIARYISGIPNGDKITLRMLANMTSGVAGYYTKAFLDRYFGNPSTVFSPDELIAYGVSASPVFAPGERFDYSNTNTVLLGKVIEKVTGHSIKEELDTAILEPLRLTDTSWPGDSPELPTPHPQGYTLQGSGTLKEPADATRWNPSFGWTAGAMISTVHDLLVYDRAVGTGRGLLSKEMQTERLTSFPAPAGYGLAMGCIDGWVGHTGELPGFNTTVYYDTKTDTSVVVLANSDIPSGKCSESATLTDNPSELPCSSPATRVFVGVSAALGHTFEPVPSK